MRWSIMPTLSCSVMLGRLMMLGHLPSLSSIKLANVLVGEVCCAYVIPVTQQGSID